MQSTSQQCTALHSSIQYMQDFVDLPEESQDLTNMTSEEAPPVREDPPDVLNKFFGGNLLSQEPEVLAPENSDRIPLPSAFPARKSARKRKRTRIYDI